MAGRVKIVTSTLTTARDSHVKMVARVTTELATSIANVRHLKQVTCHLILLRVHVQNYCQIEEHGDIYACNACANMHVHVQDCCVSWKTPVRAARVIHWRRVRRRR